MRTLKSLAILTSLLSGLAWAESSQDLISRAKSSEWASYNWSLSRGEWVNALKTADKDHYFLVQHIIHDFNLNKITDHSALFSFFLRVQPCTDGEYAQSIGQTLAKMASLEPEIISKSLHQEENALKTELESKTQIRCVNELKAMGAKYPMAFTLGQVLNEELHGPKKAQLKSKLQALKSEGSELKALVSML